MIFRREKMENTNKKKVASYDSIGRLLEFIDNFNNAKVCKMSPTVFRSFECLENCGSCCMSHIALDYTEGPRLEKFKKNFPEEFKKFEKIIVDGQEVYRYFSNKKNSRYCDFLDTSNGRCKIHGSHPFSCDMLPLKIVFKNGEAFAAHHVFGRSWQYTQIDGSKGVKCIFGNVSNGEVSWPSTLYRINLLKELKILAEKFGRSGKRIQKLIDRMQYWYDRKTVPDKFEIIDGAEEDVEKNSLF
jgi:Fe-S-cluster containining protein